MGERGLVILARPNGAGKTTASKFILRDVRGIAEFVNADTTASGLSAFAPERVAIKAGRIVLRRIATLIVQRANFAFETTLSSLTFTRTIARAQPVGYDVELIFLALPSAEIAVARVAQRGSLGGHHIPTDTIRRRFRRGIINLFAMYMPLVNRWKVFDNYTSPPTLVARGAGRSKKIYEESVWAKRQQQAKQS